MSAESSPHYTAAKEQHKNATALNEIAQEWMNQANASMNRFKNAIQEGDASTGDKLKDILIIRHGFDAEKYEERYRELQERLKGKRGELVLRVENRVEKNPGFHNMRDSSLDNLVTYSSVGLGVLTAENLDLSPNKTQDPWDHFGSNKNGALNFSTDGYVAKLNGGFHRGQIEYIHKLLSADLTDLDIKLEKTNSFSSFDPKPSMKLEVAVGNDEVSEWFLLHKQVPLKESLIATINNRQLV